jgi:RNA polymerase sigma-70 factor (ECF subfamily)
VDPLARLDERERASRVRLALQTLPAVQRAALTRYYFDVRSYEETAEALGVPLNTLKSHIRRAKLRLAGLLSGKEKTWTAGK